MHGLVVGRFQPFHNGHLALVKQAIEECVHVTVAIGSSDASGTLRNPFSFEERRAMVEATGLPVTIVAVPDLHDPPRWAQHCLELTGPMDRVYGNDESWLDLFDRIGIEVRSPGFMDRGRFEGRVLRALLAEGDPAWRKAVPAGVAAVLDAIEAPKRLMSVDG